MGPLLEFVEMHAPPRVARHSSDPACRALVTLRYCELVGPNLVPEDPKCPWLAQLSHDLLYTTKLKRRSKQSATMHQHHATQICAVSCRTGILFWSIACPLPLLICMAIAGRCCRGVCRSSKVVIEHHHSDASHVQPVRSQISIHLLLVRTIHRLPSGSNKRKRPHNDTDDIFLFLLPACADQPHSRILFPRHATVLHVDLLPCIP